MTMGSSIRRHGRSPPAASLASRVVVLAAFATAAACSGRPVSSPSHPPPSAPSTDSPSLPSLPSGITPTPSPPRFRVVTAALDATVRARMISSESWHPGCPVSLDDLRLLTLSYWGFDDQAHTGRLVVHRDAATAIATAMRRLFRARFPIRRMRLVDAYGASDDRSMADDNTSAFNCRRVPGSSRAWSQHAYGRAIDINPRENPEVAGDRVLPPESRAFVDRTRRGRGMIRPDGAVARAFASVGWSWGGDWISLKDYQHFSANGT
jgi:hypothetical protein